MELCKLNSIFINIMTHYVSTITINILLKSPWSLILKKRITILFLFTYTSFQNVHLLIYILLTHRMNEKCTAIPTEEPTTQTKKKSSVNIRLLKDGLWVMASRRLKKIIRSVHLKPQCRRMHVWTVTTCVLKNSRCNRNHLKSNLLHCCMSQSPLTSLVQTVDFRYTQK